MTEKELIEDGWKKKLVEGVETYWDYSKSGKTVFELQEVPGYGWFSSRIIRTKTLKKEST